MTYKCLIFEIYKILVINMICIVDRYDSLK